MLVTATADGKTTVPEAGSMCYSLRGKTTPRAFSAEHIQPYLEEFTFRFNRRTSSSRGKLFRRLLEQAVATLPVMENDMLHGYHWKPQKTREK